jgi:glycosyltransferase involved in cell wall biosynthesis
LTALVILHQSSAGIGALPRLKRLAFVGNSLPRRCGIATFTTDLQQAVAGSFVDIDTSIVAMTDKGRSYAYPRSVSLEIRADIVDDYRLAADHLNASQVELVSLQHEFGIFGGVAGDHVLVLLSRLTMPIVTTLHTVLAEPSPAQRGVLLRITELSSKIVVMAEKGRELLRSVYRVPAEKIEVIPHGIPDFAFVEPDGAKAKLGFAGRAVILTFGLLSPAKGIETVIDAMPLILESRPDAVYVVLGATHPNLVRDQGEAYRESLMARVRKLGLRNAVRFLDQFVDQATLLDFISMCDVYVTPYLNAGQMTSGTLAYSFGLGKAVVSTPYWHARELLADGRGVLVPFGNAESIGTEIAGLLTDEARRQSMRHLAYASSRSMTWSRTAERYMTVFASARRDHRLRIVAGSDEIVSAPVREPPPAMSTGHLLSMCDDTGLFQHAVHAVPDRAHGYCIDDNARALLVACALNDPGEQRLSEALTTRLAAFVQHAWNPATRRFRNFMSFDRHWLEESGSEDSQGRTLWALGECARADANPSRRLWAASLFAEALPAAEGFTSPRAWAFALLGLDGYCDAVPGHLGAEQARRCLADRLAALLSVVETDDWTWFEEGLSYDNARLPQALIVTGLAIDVPGHVEAGLRSLRWLMALQTTPQGSFRPVGTASFGSIGKPPEPFDQQPLEATAAISACLAAWRADGDLAWRTDAARAFAWFFGENDLSVPLVDPDTGSCRDGLHSDRANENRGGESAVSYLLALAEIRRLARLGSHRAARSPPPYRRRLIAVSALPPEPRPH